MVVGKCAAMWPVMPQQRSLIYMNNLKDVWLSFFVLGGACTQFVEVFLDPRASEFP